MRGRSQGVGGGVQWWLKLPELVWVHVALATLTWLTVLWTVATAGRLEPRQAAAQATGPGEHRREPALTQS
jgi:cytochrome c oxidase assembly protein subunit 15